MRRWILLGAAMLGACAASPAREPVCETRAAIGAELAAKFGEAPVWRGMSEHGDVVELYIAPHGATWTLVRVGAAGGACAVDAGPYWDLLQPPAPGRDG